MRLIDSMTICSKSTFVTYWVWLILGVPLVIKLTIFLGRLAPLLDRHFPTPYCSVEWLMFQSKSQGSPNFKLEVWKLANSNKKSKFIKVQQIERPRQSRTSRQIWTPKRTQTYKFNPQRKSNQLLRQIWTNLLSNSSLELYYIKFFIIYKLKKKKK
jgi:hypothetical protein